ncbi:signal peptidase I [Gracilimonas sp. Q87]|uniref:signal peptidase I n=1 Tax=Gracilimonas sp. Q87 TaxID=3384766 RepID=UPI0039844C97
MKKLFIYGLVIILITISIRFSFSIYKVQSSSMSQTIKQGDYVVVFNYDLGRSIRQNDIVAFTKIFNTKPIVFIKRAVGQPGDTLFANKHSMIINQVEIPHDTVYDLLQVSLKDSTKEEVYFDYLLENTKAINATFMFASQNEDYLVVPSEYYFLVGDNYNRSMDSRFWGFIHKDQIIGKVIAII